MSLRAFLAFLAPLCISGLGTLRGSQVGCFGVMRLYEWPCPENKWGTIPGSLCPIRCWSQSSVIIDAAEGLQLGSNCLTFFLDIHSLSFCCLFFIAEAVYVIFKTLENPGRHKEQSKNHVLPPLGENLALPFRDTSLYVRSSACFQERVHNFH